ncbi:prostate stem cell antigen [Podarcis raffonei]|uniref:prostate stem cell antigen n=1 Tax=Podarcis raffonei TaxID=65483 RepID=UPI00232925B9|nr:prostate stem cell antigen [Podarcis raffonei]XP_053251143.1 prostate stem cell antigen [Podarcis raffonei]
MKALLIFVVAGSFFMQPTGSLKCYTCNTQVNNNNCKGQQNCDGIGQVCKTDVIGVVGLFNVISKECTASCDPYFSDFKVGRRNVSCCSTDLCNVNGASDFKMGYIQVALALSASLACILLRSRL